MGLFSFLGVGRRGNREGSVARCRELSWEGFEHVHEAESAGRGVLFVIEPGTEMAAARAALETFVQPAPEWIERGDAILVGGSGRWLAAPADVGARQALEAAASAAEVVVLEMVYVVKGRGNAVVRFGRGSTRLPPSH